MKGVEIEDNEQIEDTDFNEIAENSIVKKYGKFLVDWDKLEYDDKQKLRAKINRFLAYRGLPFIDMDSVVAKSKSFG
jgi:SOS response regulatory protein OraA/RecX